MRVIDTISEFSHVLDLARRDGRTIGFVPTMGYLHDGHLSLMRRSRNECDLSAVSIFVNPLQFAPEEDLASYPRDLPRDLQACEAVGVDVVFAPPVEEMYPEPTLTTVSVAELSERMEGAARPTHFAGVATVVAKLFNITGPCRAYFGEKDYQQLVVIRRMVKDLNQPVEVVGCPIVREPDGLAMSSRNVYLSDEERGAAIVIYRALQVGAAAIFAGERDATAVARLMADIIAAEPLAALDYAEVVDADDLRPITSLEPGSRVRLLAAAKVGAPRLLDNLGVEVPA
ncbi:MAG: pantoate--beta-alanine ligase [Acidimicrobiales bacterium]|nr:pantoate--beta-alanine ligase [Acidimicrobiales bacterium]